MKFNNSVQMALVQAGVVSSAKYSVIPRDGRFLVCRRLTMTDNTFDVVDDCRSEGFAKRRAEALNNRLVQEPTVALRPLRQFDKETTE